MLVEVLARRLCSLGVAVEVVVVAAAAAATGDLHLVVGSNGHRRWIAEDEYLFEVAEPGSDRTSPSTG